MLYFTYGSNMCSARLQARVETVQCLGRAVLPGYALHCDKHSQVDGSGKFTIAADHPERVPGVLFELAESAMDRLDDFEGPGYRRLHVQLGSEAHGLIDALTYIALDEARDPSLRPYDWYRDFAVAGAIEHELPARHIHRLQDWPVWPDPDEARAERKRTLLSLT